MKTLKNKPVNYWAARDPDDFTEAQRNFIGWVKAAIKKAGTLTDLAEILSARTGRKYARRKIQYWLKGVGPSRPARDRILPVLIQFVNQKAQVKK